MISQKDDEVVETFNVKSTIREPVHDELSSDLDNYRVEWRSSELGPYRRSNSPIKKTKTKPTRPNANMTSFNSKTGNALFLYHLQPSTEKIY